MRWLVLVMVFGLVTACGGGDDDGAGDAGEFAKQNVDTQVKGQWARAYDTLHPEHQAIVPRELFIECSNDKSFPALEIEVEEVFEEQWDVARVGEMETTAVTLKLIAGDNSEFHTSHLIDVDGEWKWITGEEELAAYEQGNCP